MTGENRELFCFLLASMCIIIQKYQVLIDSFHLYHRVLLMHARSLHSRSVRVSCGAVESKGLTALQSFQVKHI